MKCAGHLARREHRLHEPIQHQARGDGGDGVAHDVAEHRQCDRRGEQRVDARARVVVAAEEHETSHVFGVIEREGERDHRAHRMADDYRLFDAELGERRVEQLRLGRRRPEAIARPGAVAKAGTIERDHAVIARQAVEQAARLEVALRDHVAVDQHDRGPFALLDNMQAHAVDLEQAAGGRVVTLGSAGAAFDPSGGEGCTEQRGAGPNGGARGREGFEIGSVHCTSQSSFVAVQYRPPSHRSP